jgi:hypothetical protein
MVNRALTILVLVTCVPCALAQQASGPPLRQIDRNDLCVTNGAVSVLPGDRLAIDTPSSRAVVRVNSQS